MRIKFKNVLLVLAVLFACQILFAGNVCANETKKIGELFEKSYAAEAVANYPVALNSVLQILRLEPDNYVALLRAGWLSYLKKSHEDFVEYYNKADALKQNAVEAKFGLLYPLAILKKWDDFENVLSAIIKIDNNNYNANSRLAYLLYANGQYKKALSYYKKLLELYLVSIT